MAFLVWLIALPLLGALLSFFSKEKRSKDVALFFAAVTLLLAFSGLANFSGNGMRFVESNSWIPSLGITFSLGVDGISFPLVLLSVFIFLVAVTISRPLESKQQQLYYPLFLILEAAVLLIFCALDAFLFYIGWEIVLISMYFIIALWGGPNKKYASMKFLIYTHIASLVLLLSIIALYLQSGAQTFNWTQWIGYPFASSAAAVIFAALTFAFIVKMPMVPFHTWLPDAHVEAPTAGSVVLAGLLLKLGAYGMIRAIQILPSAALFWQQYLFWIAFITILYGSVVSIIQQDLKRMIAYSSVGHMGFVLLGIASLNSIGLTGALFMMVSHGLISPMLFILAGIIHHQTGTREISKLSGLAKKMPMISWMLVFASLATMGLPALSGFVAEFIILIGSFQAFGVLGVIPVIASAITTAYMIWTLQRTVFSTPVSSTLENVREHPSLAYSISLSLMVLLIVLLGLIPTLLLNLVKL